MPLPYTDEALLIVAVERLRMAVANLPLSIAMNAGRKPPPLQPAAFDRPSPVIVMGPNPLPVSGTGGGGGGGPKAPPKEKDGAGLISQAIKQFIGTFTAMLGPVAVFAAIVGSELSGVRVLTGALNVFASAVAPILLPAVYMIAVALVAASDVVWKKILPGLEGFYRTVIQDLIPAVEHFADVCGKAAAVLIKIASIGGFGGESGGFFGGLNRTTDRLGAGPDPDAGKSGAQRAENALDDLVRVMSAGTAEPLIRGKNWLEGKLGVDKGAPGAASEEARRARQRAMLDANQELLMSMGSHGGVGTIQGNWAAAQNAATNMTPFQQKVLDRLQQTVAALERATGPAGGTGVYTEGGGVMGLVRSVIAALPPGGA